MFPFIVVSQATSIQTLFLTEKLWFLGDNVECELETWCGLRCTHLTHIPFISTWLELSFIHREFISIADVKITATTIRTFVDFRTFSSSHKFSIPNMSQKFVLSLTIHPARSHAMIWSLGVTKTVLLWWDIIHHFNEKFFVRSHNGGLMRMMTSQTR